MSHECHECGQQCYCDGDDTGGLPDTDCVHACDPADFVDADEDFEIMRQLSGRWEK